MAKMKIDGECWIWTGANTGGKFRYGRIRITVDQIESTHVLSYKEFIGPIANGLCVLHRCDNPPCFNPKHLFLGTKRENAADMFSKNRENRRDGINNGNSKLTATQVEEIRSLYGRGPYRGGTFTQTKIANMFGITQAQVGYIIRRRLWAK